MSQNTYTFGQMLDMARDIADYRRYGFRFQESFEKVVHGNRVPQNLHNPLKDMAGSLWGKDDRE